MKTFWLSVMSWHGISDWFWPLPLSRPTTPLLVVDPCDQYIQPSPLKASCSVGWSPVGRLVMNGGDHPGHRVHGADT